MPGVNGFQHASTNAGLEFLKCALAPEDFGNQVGTGIPDEYVGKTLPQKHYATVQLSLPVNTDRWLVFAPTLGTAYWSLSLPAGTLPGQADVWTQNQFPDYNSLFGSTGQEARVVEQFRYISNVARLVPLTNSNQWSGSISCFRLPLRMTQKANTPGGELYWTVQGLEGLSALGNEMKILPFNQGMTAVALNQEPHFRWLDVIENQTKLPTNLLASSDFGQLNGPVPGFGDLDTIVFYISGVSGVAESCMLQVFSAVEYKCNASSIVYNYQRPAPAYDPLALASYRAIAREMPLGVSCFDNDSFWDWVLRVLDNVSSALTFVPGPVGMIAAGVNTVTKGVGSLRLV